jgi:hypothetical protein
LPSYSSVASHQHARRAAAAVARPGRARRGIDLSMHRGRARSTPADPVATPFPIEAAREWAPHSLATTLCGAAARPQPRQQGPRPSTGRGPLGQRVFYTHWSIRVDQDNGTDQYSGTSFVYRRRDPKTHACDLEAGDALSSSRGGSDPRTIVYGVFKQKVYDQIKPLKIPLNETVTTPAECATLVQRDHRTATAAEYSNVGGEWCGAVFEA